MQVIPALDLLGDDAVRLEQGDYERVIFRQPLEEFMGRLVATAPALIHVVDLQGAREGALRPAVIERCRRAAGRSPSRSRAVFAVSKPPSVRSTPAPRGSSSAPRCGTTTVRSKSSSTRSGPGCSPPSTFATGTSRFADGSSAPRSPSQKRSRAAGPPASARLHVTAIDRDGTMRGPDLALYEEACASAIPVVAAGGVRDDADVAELERVGCEAAVMGLGYLAVSGYESVKRADSRDYDVFEKIARHSLTA